MARDRVRREARRQPAVVPGRLCPIAFSLELLLEIIGFVVPLGVVSVSYKLITTLNLAASAKKVRPVTRGVMSRDSIRSDAGTVLGCPPSSRVTRHPPRLARSSVTTPSAS